MRKYWYVFVLLLLVACTPESHPETIEPTARNTQEEVTPVTETTTPPAAAELKDYGTAPELTNEIWLNVESPLRLANLRGKVVLLDMWTFG